MSSRVKVRNTSLYREEEGKILVFEEEEGVPFLLQGSGADVWRLCVQRLSLSEMVDRLCADYSAPRRQIEADVRRFLNELQEARLIQWE